MFWLIFRTWELFIFLYGPLAVVRSWKAAKQNHPNENERSAA